MVVYSIPYTTTKDLATAYNSECARLPEHEDWVVFIDSDVMFLESTFGSQIEKIINDNPEVRAFTGTTNRIGTDWQKVSVEGDDIRTHRDQAKKSWSEHGSKVDDVTNEQLMSGFLIAIRKDFWLKIGGFKQWYSVGHSKRGMLGVDNMFHKDVAKHGKLYLAKGLYLYHWGRGGDMSKIDHLT